MKGILFILFFAIVGVGFAQTADGVLYFSGYVLDEDSIPVENAYLINYRTLRAYAVDENGWFKIKVQPGDSLKINHISFKQRIVHVNSEPDSSNVFNLSFEPYIVEAVTVKHRDLQLEYFNRNMELIFAQMKLNPPMHYQRGAVVNTYAPGAQQVGFGVNLEDLIGLFKKLKR